jgi:hypothetical protein
MSNSRYIEYYGYHTIPFFKIKNKKYIYWRAGLSRKQSVIVHIYFSHQRVLLIRGGLNINNIIMFYFYESWLNWCSIFKLTLTSVKTNSSRVASFVRNKRGALLLDWYQLLIILLYFKRSFGNKYFICYRRI